jgi:hypothetical protein
VVNVLPYIYTLNGLYVLLKRVVFALGHLCEAKLDNKSRKSLCSMIMVFLDLYLVGMQRARCLSQQHFFEFFFGEIVDIIF